MCIEIVYGNNTEDSFYNVNLVASNTTEFGDVYLSDAEASTVLPYVAKSG